MDKVIIFLEVMKKRHFWVMCGVIFITSIVVWSMGTSAMQSEVEKRESELTGFFGQQQQIMGKPLQPNDEYLKKVEVANGELIRQVAAAWQELYFKQKPYLIWPRGLQGYADELYRWPELDPIPELPVHLRRAYQDELKQANEMNRFRSIIQLYEEIKKEPKDGKGGKTGFAHDDPANVGPRGKNRDIEIRGLVRWPGFDQLLAKYTWIYRHTPPSDLEMRYTQEDLWVYESILTSLAKLNAGVPENQPDKAWLKEIIDLQLGSTAPISLMTVNLLADLPVAVATGPGGVGMPGAYPGGGGGEGNQFPTGLPGGPSMNPGGPGMGLPGGPSMNPGGPGMGLPGGPGGAGATGLSPDAVLKQNRYCNLDGVGFSAADVDTKLQEDQFRLMPVRIEVVVDQRKVPELLAVCASAIIPIRIKQVQMFKSTPGGQAPVGGGGIGNNPPGGGVGGQQANNGARSDSRFTWDVRVEIRGMAHLYQQPNPSKLPKIEGADPNLVSNPTGATDPAAAPATESAPDPATTAPATEGAPEPAAGDPAAVAPAAGDGNAKEPAKAGAEVEGKTAPTEVKGPASEPAKKETER